jgi:hypothetical protein
MAIITTAEYKTYAGISGIGDDTFIGVCINAATAALQRLTGRTFEGGTFTEKYSIGPDQRSIQLRNWPVASVTSVTQLLVNGGTYVLDSSIYTFDATRGVLYFYNEDWGRWFVDSQYDRLQPYDAGYRPAFEPGTFNYSIVYVAGSAVTDDLKYALYQYVDAMFASRRRDPAMQSQSIGQYSYTLGKTGGLSELAGTLFGPFVPGGVV